MPLSALCMTKLHFFDRGLSASNSSLERCCGTLALQLQKDVKAISLILVFIKSKSSQIEILTNGNNKFDLEIKENLLIKRDRPILKKALVLLNYFFLTIVSFLIVSLYNNIV